MWEVNSHNPLSGQCPLNHQGVLQEFIGAPNGKNSKDAHITRESIPLKFLLLLFAEKITLLVVETNGYYHQFLDNFKDGISPHLK
jgi:hypothetical protein